MAFDKIKKFIGDEDIPVNSKDSDDDYYKDHHELHHP